MNSSRDPHPTAVDATFVPSAPAGAEATVAPAVDDPSRELTGEPTDPGVRTHASGGAAHTQLDATRPAQPHAAAFAAGDADATRTAVSAPAAGGGRPAPAGVAVERYVLRGFHAKGGLGEVYKALDLELEREVAFKRMQVGFADDPRWRETFVDEARITARLDHPGVVPVFGLVADGHGRPCYAMRFITGATLRQKIDQFHGTGRPAAPPEPADPAERQLAFRQLLQRFVAVCQAVGYAHTQGVVHRDLKPANIMVGEFGETLVVDWGLARHVGGPGAAGPVGAADPTAGTVTIPLDPEEKTTGGHAVGTPAFMPPEQAVGSPEAWPAADVFGLGAILFYTLTGRAPYSSGGDASATIQLAQRAEYPRPRAVAATVPPALEAVCVKAMALAPGDRYESALDLAADIERWLSDEPVTAYRDPPAARAARWARRNPARVAIAVTGLVAGLVAAVAIAAVVQVSKKQVEGALEVAKDERAKAVTERDRATKAEVATGAALMSLAAQQEKTLEQKAAAEAARATAEDRFQLAQSAFGTLVGDVQDELDDRAGAQKLRAAVLTKALAGLDALCDSAEGKADHAEAHRLRAWARLQMGDVRRTLGQTREALNDYQIAATAATDLEKAKHPPAPRAGLADAHDRLADTYLALGDVRKAAAAADAAGKLRPVQPTTPGEIDAAAGTLDRIAAVALEEGQTHKATGATQAALKLREAQFGAAPKDVAALRGLAAALDRDAEVKLRVGDTAGATKSAAAAVERRTAAAEMSDRSGPRRELAASLDRQAEVAAERADLTTELRARQAAVTVLAALAAADSYNAAARADLAVARGRLGVARLHAGDLAAAQAATATARTEADAFAKTDPTSPRALRAVGITRWDRGDVLLAAGETAAAVAEFEAAVTAFEALEAADADSARARRDAAEARERLAAARVAAGTPAAALGPLAASVEVRRTAAEADPANARAARDLAAAYGRLGDARLAAGRYAAAEEAAAAAAALLRTRAAADPANLAAGRDLAAARSAWARVTTARGEQTLTLVLLNQARDGFDATAAADGASAAASEEKAVALTRLADALADADFPDFRLEREREALALREKVAAANADSPIAQRGVVTSKRRVAEALTAARHFKDAAKLYADAEAVLGRFPGSPVLAPEAKAVAEGVEVLAGVRAAAANRESVKDLAPPVRARVLRQLADDYARQNYTVEATWAAARLAECARDADDVFRAAVVFARAASPKGAPAAYGDKAVELLGKAADRGFNNPDLLRARWWDAVRGRPAFQAIEARLTAPPAK